MTAREQIARDKPLGAWLSSVVNDPQYDKLELILQSDICKMDSIDEIHGAMKVLESLRTIAIAAPPEMKTPSSGIEHNFTKQ
jgi:hypothetical protein